MTPDDGEAGIHDERGRLRGSGLTTKQMTNAPACSVYVWCNHHLGYPWALAQQLGRTDLRIVSPDWVTEKRWAGVRVHVVFDHAFGDSNARRLTNSEWETYLLLRDYLKARGL